MKNMQHDSSIFFQKNDCAIKPTCATTKKNESIGKTAASFIKNKLMKVLHLLPFVFCVALVCSCKKEKKEETVNNIRFTRNALDYVNLQPGKYFIYKDSATGSTDSVVVTTSLLESIYVPRLTGNWLTIAAHYMEKLTLKLDAKKTNGTSQQWLYGTAEANSFLSVPCDTAYIYLSGGESNLQSEVFFQYHYQNSTETMIVEGTAYNKVVTDVNDNSLPLNDPNYRKTIFSWAKGIGIIKRTIITTGGVAKTSTLLRHN